MRHLHFVITDYEGELLDKATGGIHGAISLIFRSMLHRHLKDRGLMPVDYPPPHEERFIPPTAKDPYDDHA